MDDLIAYTWKTEVASYEADRNDRLRLSAILRLMQESGDRQTAAEQAPGAQTERRACMVLLSRAAVQVHRYPTVREQLSVTTLQRTVRGVRMYRDFIFRVGEETVVEATNEYFCADPHTRKVIRPDAYLHSGMTMNESFQPRNLQPGRIVLPEEMEATGERTVYESFVDSNGHMNNAWYCDFAVDALPEELRRRSAKTLRINYIHEALPGSTLSLFAARQGETAFVRGDLGNVRSFAAEMTYETPDE